MRTRLPLACLLALVAAAAQAQAPAVTKIDRGEFALPIQLDPATRSRIKELKLYLIGADGTWRLEQAAVASQAEFRVKLDRPGIYGFRIVAVDLAGNHHPPRLEGIAPQQWVEVKSPLSIPVAEPAVAAAPTPAMPPVVEVMPSDPEKPTVAVAATPTMEVAKPVPVEEPKVVPVEAPVPVAAEEPVVRPMPGTEGPTRLRIVRVRADPNEVRIKEVTALPEPKR